MRFYFFISFVILFLLYIHYHDKELLNLNLNLNVNLSYQKSLVYCIIFFVLSFVWLMEKIKKENKFAYVLDVFFFVFHKMQNQKSSSWDKIHVREKQKNKNKRKTKTNSVWRCLIFPKCTGSVNGERGVRVTSYVHVYLAHFWFLEMWKEM